MKVTATLSLTVALMITSLAVMPGCQSASKSRPAASSNPIKDEFDAGRDRKPTAQTLYAMARLLIARGQDDQAVHVLSRINEEYPRFVPAYNELAEIHMRNDATARAVEKLEAGLAVEPGNALLHNNLGLCRLVLDDAAGAEASFAKAVELSPHNARYHANHATALAMLGEYDAAVLAYQAAMPEQDAHYNVAVICESRGDTDRAAAEYELAKDKR